MLQKADALVVLSSLREEVNFCIRIAALILRRGLFDSSWPGAVSASVSSFVSIVRLAIEPIFESGFCDGSYGFRPERGCRDALRVVDRLLKCGRFRHPHPEPCGRRGGARAGQGVGGGERPGAAPREDADRQLPEEGSYFAEATRIGRPRDSLDEDTTNWRVVCGKNATTVRRAGA